MLREAMVGASRCVWDHSLLVLSSSLEAYYLVEVGDLSFLFLNDIFFMFPLKSKLELFVKLFVGVLRKLALWI